MHICYEIFPDRGDLGCLFFLVGGVALIFERIEIFLGGWGVAIFFWEVRVELFQWVKEIFCLYPSLY